MSTAEYRETAPPISRLGTGADTAPGAFLLLSAYPRRCRMLVSPMSTQTALCTILSMMASACTPPPSLGCQSFFLSCVQKTVEAVPYLSSISSSSIDLNYVSGLSSSHSPPRGHQYVLDTVLRDAGGAGDRVLRQTVHRPQPQDLPGPILLAIWNLLVLWTAWQPERNGGGRGRLLAVPNGNIRLGGRRCRCAI